MHPDFDNFDPDDNFAHSFSATPEDLDEDAALEAVAWQFLLLINPGDEDAALLQFNEAREALASGTAPVDALRDAIDWKAGFWIAERDVGGLVEVLDELAARIGVRIDWDTEDPSDAEFLTGTDATALLQRAFVQLREYHYTLWTYETGEDAFAGWIAHMRDDEAVPMVAGALGFHARPGV